MRFGPFVLQDSPNPEQDSEVIDRTLREAVLADKLGYDTVWLGEHHFSGTEVFADPIVFGSAVAQKTKDINIGFAVVQIGLHHPVRLAVQTAVLDNLCHGRLIVGTARGTGGSLWEYTGFGTTVDEGVDRIAEAEELVVKAWTEENVEHHGTHWDCSFPLLRPRPFQKPHPPMPRACVSEGSAAAMGRVGRPIMLWSGYGADPNDNFAKRQMEEYKGEMYDAGSSEDEVAAAVDNSWLFPFRFLYVAESDAQAEEEAIPAARQEWRDFYLMRARLNAVDQQTRSPSHLVKGMTNAAGGVFDSDPAIASAEQATELLIENRLVAGSPSTVAERIAEERDSGFTNLLFPMSLTGIDEMKVAKSMRLFSEEVAPLFKN